MYGARRSRGLFAESRATLVQTSKVLVTKRNAGYLPCRDFLACTLACSLVSYRPLARLGLTRQKRAVAPRAGRRIAWKLCATRHNSPEAWTNARLLCAPPQPLPPPSQRVRFGSRRAARAADEPAAEPAADEPAAGRDDKTKTKAYKWRQRSK